MLGKGHLWVLFCEGFFFNLLNGNQKLMNNVPGK